jgi:hypothetical protein
VTVTDYLGDLRFNNAQFQRVRDFQINNETWSLSPFVAFLATPTCRFFVQGFAELDIPLNSSGVHYVENVIAAPGAPPFVADRPGVVTPPFFDQESIRDQMLLHLDLGTGFWLMRRPENAWLTGIAPTLELHYTTTLTNAQILNLPRDPAVGFRGTGTFGANGAPNVVTFEPPNPTVGNLRGRIDLLDLTVGTTFEFANTATLATGFAFPLRTGDNRTFDWEFQIQFNIYFGGGPRAPSF